MSFVEVHASFSHSMHAERSVVLLQWRRCLLHVASSLLVHLPCLLHVFAIVSQSVRQSAGRAVHARSSECVTRRSPGCGGVEALLDNLAHAKLLEDEGGGVCLGTTPCGSQAYPYLLLVQVIHVLR
jgi:hypothetical protein